MTPVEPTLPDGCLTDLTLDRLAIGELDAQVAATARGHLAGCARCSRRQDELGAQAARFETEVPIATLAAAALAARFRHRRRRVVAAVGLALAASLAVFVGLSELSVGEAPDGRLKGTGLSLSAIGRSPDGAQRRVSSGDAMREGDALRFELSSSSDGFVAFVGIDSQGTVLAYLPENGPLVGFKSGAAQLLPFALQVSVPAGTERFFAVRCAAARDVETVRRAVLEAFARAQGQVRAMAALPLDCVQATFVLEKAPAP